MPRYICKLEGMYFEWSTVVDSPVTYGMTLEEFRDYYREEYGEEGMRGLPCRLARTEATGVSCFVRDGIDDLIAGNRANDDETEATRAEIVAMLSRRVPPLPGDEGRGRT